MKNKRNRAVGIAEALMVLPLAFLLWVVAGDIIKMHGLIVIPAGIAVYLVISLLVDKFFLQQSAQLEQALERTLSSVAEKSRHSRKNR